MIEPVGSNWRSQMKPMTPALEPEACPTRRAAGTDPAKRSQILAGANAVFARMGYDAASMSDITREAGVSKGTLYVYFAGKEDLFAATIEQHRERLFQGICDAFTVPGRVEDKLRQFARIVVPLICSNDMVQAHRVVLGICARMPELGARFYEGGSQRGVRLLSEFFAAETQRGVLDVTDTQLAAHQFMELSLAGMARRRLFGHMENEPTEAELTKTIDAAIEMFMCRYAAKDPGQG